MITLLNGQYVFLGEIVDIMDEGSHQVMCSGKVRKFIELSLYVPTLLQ